jgi:hypothetical protein
VTENIGDRFFGVAIFSEAGFVGSFFPGVAWVLSAHEFFKRALPHVDEPVVDFGDGDFGVCAEFLLLLLRWVRVVEVLQYPLVHAPRLLDWHLWVLSFLALLLLLRRVRRLFYCFLLRRFRVAQGILVLLDNKPIHIVNWPEQTEFNFGEKIFDIT